VTLWFAACATLSLLSLEPAAAEREQEPGKRSLAGQVCPTGSFVIGFDAEGDILCSATCGNGVLNAGESCDDGNTREGDGCSASCQSEAAAVAGTVAVANDASPAAAAPPTEAASPAEPVVAAAGAALTISDVEPSSVVYGKRELTITVLGSGFRAGALIEFAGATYEPTVNAQGTRAEVTLATRSLTLGAYAITVSNPSGERTTLKKALVVY